jgi:NAD-dependent deacetylase
VNELERARSLVSSASRIVFLTGAGVSAESGVPTFRGPDGLWKKHRPEELATPEAFRRDPRLVWEWYAWRRQRVAPCEPNAAHRSLAEFVRGRPEARLITQNVDGLHERAAREARPGPGDEPADGADGLENHERPIALHGSLFGDRCSRCSYRAEAGDPVDATSEATLPRCPDCGALLRPDVVWFGEALDAATITEAFRLAEQAEVLVSVGTSSLVHPAASLPSATRASGGALIEVNHPYPASARWPSGALQLSCCPYFWGRHDPGRTRLKARRASPDDSADAVAPLVPDRAPAVAIPGDRVHPAEPGVQAVDLGTGVVLAEGEAALGRDLLDPPPPPRVGDSLHRRGVAPDRVLEEQAPAPGTARCADVHSRCEHRVVERVPGVQVAGHHLSRGG